MIPCIPRMRRLIGWRHFPTALEEHEMGNLLGLAKASLLVRADSQKPSLFRTFCFSLVVNDRFQKVRVPFTRSAPRIPQVSVGAT